MITQSRQYPPFQFKTNPFKHQEDEFVRSREQKVWALFWEMGVGKTKPTIDTMAWLYLKGEIDGVIIISDKGAYRNWTDYELKIHMPTMIPTRVVTWPSSGTIEQRKQLDEIMTAKDDVLDIFVINVEAFSGGKGIDAAIKFCRAHYTMGIVDESTSIKSITSKRALAVVSLRDYCDYRRILTGTPVTNSPLDLFMQFQFLGDGLLGFSSYVCFRAEYAKLILEQQGRARFYKVVGYKNLDKLASSIKPYSSRLLKSQCLDLPEKVYVTREVSLTPQQQQAYTELKKLAVTKLQCGEIITSTNMLTLLTRLHQIVCGHVRVKDGIDDATGKIKYKTVDVDSDRINELMRIIEIVDDKVIIWCNFARDMELILAAIRKEYGRDSVVDYGGATSDAQRPRNINRFRTSPECKFFVSNQAVGGKGITLVEANAAIYYSNSFKLEHRLQSEDRIHRPGQRRTCTIIDIVAPRTIDQKIIRVLRQKTDIASEILDLYTGLLSD